MSEPMSPDPLLNAALEYGEARTAQLLWRRKMAALWCEERGEDTPACYLGASEPDDSWCESCRKRDPIYREWRVAFTAEKKALRVLQRRLERARRGV